jgi:hypothetical protein
MFNDRFHRASCVLWVGWLCLTGSAIAGAAASDPEAFQKVCEELQAATRVQADFVETKTLRMLDNPLTSSGTLLFSPQQGVYLVRTEPVRQELLITRSEFIQKDAQGSVQKMKVRSQPAARAFVDVFLSFFSGDRNRWEKAFQAEFEGSVGTWKIELIPHKKSPAAQSLQKIVLKGRGGALDALTLIEANGDQTHTVYTNHQISRNAGDATLPFPTDLKVAAP